MTDNTAPCPARAASLAGVIALSGRVSYDTCRAGGQLLPQAPQTTTASNATAEVDPFAAVVAADQSGPFALKLIGRRR